jgi:hypothetical protein
MAFSGVHIIWGFAGGDGYNSAKAALMTDPQRSETILAGGTTTLTAPGGGHRKPVARVRALVDSWVAYGSAPDASQAIASTTSTARYFVPANTDCDHYVTPGDKMNSVSA